MIIDFHTHIFPDALAPRVIPNLTHIISENPSMNGTINGLVESMRTSHIDLSIVLPVVTTKTVPQHHSIRSGSKRTL